MSDSDVITLRNLSNAPYRVFFCSYDQGLFVEKGNSAPASARTTLHYVTLHPSSCLGFNLQHQRLEDSLLSVVKLWFSWCLLLFIYFFYFCLSWMDGFLIDFLCWEAGWEDGTSSCSGCLGVLARLPLMPAQPSGHAPLRATVGGWWAFGGSAREATDASNDLAWWESKGLGARIVSKSKEFFLRYVAHQDQGEENWWKKGGQNRRLFCVWSF